MSYKTRKVETGYLNNYEKFVFNSGLLKITGVEGEHGSSEKHTSK